MTPNTRRVALVVGSIFVVVVLVIHNWPEPPSPLVEEAERVRRITTPAGGSATACMPVVVEPFQARTQWEITSQHSWQEFQTWLKDGRLSAYTLQREQVGHVEFVRTIGFDRLILTFRRRTQTPHLKVSATLTGDSS